MNVVLKPWQLLLPILAHWINRHQQDSISAADFTTVEVWARSGLVTFYILVVMHLKTRRIEFAGATPHPNSEWMQQVGRNLTDCIDGFLGGSTHVILDRDTKHFIDFLYNSAFSYVKGRQVVIYTQTTVHQRQ